MSNHDEQGSSGSLNGLCEMKNDIVTVIWFPIPASNSEANDLVQVARDQFHRARVVWGHPEEFEMILDKTTSTS